MSVPIRQILRRFGFASPFAALITASLFTLLVVLTGETARYVPIIDIKPPEFRPPPVDPTPPKDNPVVRPHPPPPPEIGKDLLPIPPVPDKSRPDRETVTHGPWNFQPAGSGNPEITRIESRDPIVVLLPRPDFPERARTQGVEGYAIVAFTVTSAGTIREARIVEAQPHGWFEKAALVAANRLRYQPKLVEGKPVEAPGMMYKFVFDLED